MKFAFSDEHFNQGMKELGFNHILTNSGKVIRKLRFSSTQRMRKHIKTIRKLKDKSIIDEEYVGMRINAFKAHLKYLMKIVSTNYYQI